MTSSQPINGVVMKGAFVNMKQHDNGSPEAPQDYIDDSLKMISKAGLDHARFLFYWEAFERDPKAFMKEIESVAKAGDKYGVKIIYDNHQWHTSSWLEDKGTGFPWSLFEDSKYSKGGGGNTPDKAAQVFWKDWWDGSVKDNEGKDGWTLMANYLKKIVLAVDNHSSTLGYEILSEPHVDNTDQWSKIGKFNSFITEELRDITSKTIVYSMNVPVDLNSDINISPQNLAKMAPSSKQNIAFKISVYGVPDRDDYQKERFDLFLDTRNLTGVPLYIGEWNNVVRTKEGGVFKINPGASDFTKSNAGKILEAFKKEGVLGTAFWKWDYRDADTASFNLVSDESGKLVPTKYFGILEDTVEKVYGSFDGVSISDVSASGNTSTPVDDTLTSDVSASGNTSTPVDGKETNLINELVRTGKFTEDEAKQFVSKSMQNGSDVTSTSDNSQSSNTQSSNTQSSNNQTNNNDQPSNVNTNNPEKYDNLNDLVDDIKNHVVDIEDISLNAFQDSGAYQKADQETQDCIDLAGKIGDNLGDQEIVNCSEDPNFYEGQISNTNSNDNNSDDNGN
jgi:polyhydroxyalkanoate synthesis regulator phasin